MPLCVKKGRTRTPTMRIAFRADASTMIGSGHVMRCLTLADMLRAQGDETIFLCREFPGNLNAEIERRGHALHRLPIDQEALLSEAADPTHASWLGDDQQTDASECAVALAAWGRPDWLVADHYAIDRHWESLMREHCEKIMVIDDLADRPHRCELLLDQNLQAHPARYSPLLPSNCRRFLGPRFALLRHEFQQFRQAAAPRNGQLGRLLVFMGGGDPGNFTATALQGILDSGLGPQLQLEIIIGSANPHQPEIEAISQQFPNARTHTQTPDIATLMANADLMIGAAGTTTWERCCLGLPSLLVSLAANQRENGRQIGRHRAALYLGDAENVSPGRISGVLRKLAARPALIRRIAQRAVKVSAGCGAALLALALHAEQLELRTAGTDDCERLWHWRNDFRTRRSAFDTRPIDLAMHRNWYRGVLDNPGQTLLIGVIRDRKIGVLRYDVAGEIAEVSVYLDPELHGLGLGSRLIAAGNRWIRDNASPINDLVARIRPENTASRKAFGEAGFRREDKDQLTLHWHPDRFRDADLRPGH